MSPTTNILMKTKLLDRGHFFRAAGTIIALPTLESIDFWCFASASATTVTRPKRAVFLGFDWGVTENTCAGEWDSFWPWEQTE